MAYRLKHSEAVSDEIERVVKEEINRSVAEIDDPGLAVDIGVHQVRKRCKKIRAVLRLAREPLDRDGAFDRENTFFRDLAAGLADLRDAEMLIQTHDALVTDIANPDLLIECAAVRGQLVARRCSVTITTSRCTGRCWRAKHTGSATTPMRSKFWPLSIDAGAGCRPASPRTGVPGGRRTTEACRLQSTEDDDRD